MGDEYAKPHSITRDKDGNLEMAFTNAETVRFTYKTMLALARVLAYPPRGWDIHFCPHCGEVLKP